MGDEQVDTGAAVPKSNTFGSAGPFSQPLTHPSTVSQQEQKFLARNMGPGYHAVTEGASQMEDSLKTTVSR